MIALFAYTTIWYLAFVDSNKTITIPQPYTTKERCLEAGEEQYNSNRDSPNETWLNYFICVQAEASE